MAKVLVIDDEPSIAILVGEIIEGYGHQVYTAFNGLQGLDFIKQNKLDMIISDIMMPHITGRELLYFVRSQPELNDVYFVLMSAVSHLARQVTTYEPDAFLVKPFDISRIDEIVQIFLSKQDSNRTVQRSIPITFPYKPHHDSFFLVN